MFIFYKTKNNNIKIYIGKIKNNLFYEWLNLNKFRKLNKKFINYDIQKIPDTITNTYLINKNKFLKKAYSSKYYTTINNNFLLLKYDSKIHIYKPRYFNTLTQDFLDRWGNKIFGDNLIKIKNSKYLFSIKYKKFYIGNSKKSSLTSKNKYYGDKYKNNSVIISDKNNNYFLISNIILQFSLNEEILFFYSPMVSKNRNYPYFLTKEYVYIILYKKIKKLNRRYLPYYIKHNQILQFIFSNKFIEEKLEFIKSKLII